MIEPHIHVRRATSKDVSTLCRLLNAIIEAGGTTALETPLAEREFDDQFVDGAHVLFCFVAEHCATGRQVGFQCVSSDSTLPEGWGDIATFAQPAPKIGGVGTALFQKTKVAAGDAGLAALNAEIRADNRGGLAYYEKMGFRTYRVAEGVPLRNGRLVDRIYKRYGTRISSTPDT